MTHSSDAKFTWDQESNDPAHRSTWMKVLLKEIDQSLLPQVVIKSIDPHDPVEVSHVPMPWQVLGTGNYAAVFAHPQFPDQVVKIYAPDRPGLEEEREVYQRLGSHPAFSECYYASPSQNFLVLKRLYGTTLYGCLHQGKLIPKQVIRDIDRALIYARSRDLYPHDIHARNVMMCGDRGLVVDVSDFLHQDPCSKWKHLKRAYYWLYLPIIAPLRLRVPYSLLDAVRKLYRRLFR